MVYIPDDTARDKLPVVSPRAGAAVRLPRCAVSKFDASLQGINEDAWRMVYPLVGSGYAVIVPDFAGYANFGAARNPPSAYAQATDVGRSTLDGGRALKKLFPALDDKVVLVGHSQGGHSALRSTRTRRVVRTAGPIVGARSTRRSGSANARGARAHEPVGRGYNLGGVVPSGAVASGTTTPRPSCSTGPASGRKMFAGRQAGRRRGVRHERVLGLDRARESATYAHELFDRRSSPRSRFPAAAGAAVRRRSARSGSHRYSADRPHLTGSRRDHADPPRLRLKDTTIPPDRMKCALDRLKADNASSPLPRVRDRTRRIVSARGEYVGRLDRERRARRRRLRRPAQ